MNNFIEEELNIKIYKKEIEDLEINISKINDKVLFFYEINTFQEIEEYIEKLTYIFHKNGYKKIINELVEDENKSNRFINRNDFSLPEFLWDLYIVFIRIGNIRLPYNKKNRVERDDFFARKIIIEGQTKEEIIEALSETLFPEKTIENLLNKVSVKDNDLAKIFFLEDENKINKCMIKEFKEYCGYDGYSIDDVNLKEIKEFLSYLDNEIKDLKEKYENMKGEF